MGRSSQVVTQVLHQELADACRTHSTFDLAITNRINCIELTKNQDQRKSKYIPKISLENLLIIDVKCAAFLMPAQMFLLKHMITKMRVRTAFLPNHHLPNPNLMRIQNQKK